MDPSLTLLKAGRGQTCFAAFSFIDLHERLKTD